MNNRYILLLIIFVLFLSGCTNSLPIKHVPFSLDQKNKKIVIFFDGTANDEGSHTNISKLYNLVTLQNNPKINSIYIEGVGTKGKLAGAGLGWGIGNDVRQAYLFLLENYHHKKSNKIYIFGFSRGAYSSRILASLLYVAGIPDVKNLNKKERKKLVKNIYSAYKGNKSNIKRKRDVCKVLKKESCSKDDLPHSVEVEFMGLWDTVEALGVPDYKENNDIPNKQYFDQLCNIKKVAQALSLDDDRARIFTPIFLTSSHLTTECSNKHINVEEVWFSGAHSDVGGGYRDTTISGISLNWMLYQIKPYHLVPDGTKVYADPYSKTHNPEAGYWGLIYHNKSRSINDYIEKYHQQGQKIKIHKSVIKRLECVKPKKYESRWFEKFPSCFKTYGNVKKFIKNNPSCSEFIDIVGDGYTDITCHKETKNGYEDD